MPLTPLDLAAAPVESPSLERPIRFEDLPTFIHTIGNGTCRAIRTSLAEGDIAAYERLMKAERILLQALAQPHQSGILPFPLQQHVDLIMEILGAPTAQEPSELPVDRKSLGRRILAVMGI